MATNLAAVWAFGAQGVVSGVVRDLSGSVAGATVRVQATENATTTVADGSFSLVVTEGEVVTVTAWRAGYLVGWVEAVSPAKGLVIKLERHHTSDNPDYDWFTFEGSRGSRTCGHCMPGISRRWAEDAHARSAVNPRFLSMYRGTDLEGRRSPLTRRVIEQDYGERRLAPDTDASYRGPGYRLDFPDTTGSCAACHAPAAAARTDRAFTTNPEEVSGVEAEGIFCELCHKIGAVILDEKTLRPFDNMPGILSMQLLRPDERDEIFFGTLDDVTRRVSKLPLEEESAFCAPCHSARFWDTPIYDSYGEWLASPYSDPETGKTCQDCHMPVTEEEYIALEEVGGLRRAAGFVSDHHMPGAADVDFIMDSVLLKLDGRRTAEGIEVEVRITNRGVGHHLPTGHPARNMVLVVSATDGLGRELPLVEGRRIPSWGGELAGLPGKGFAKVLEDPWTGEWPTVAYWNPTTIRDDTRIPALATDQTRYIFAAPASSQVVVVSTRLIFRRAYPELARQKLWVDPDLVVAQREIDL
jgi:nitrate/TMAO reductase-like tetraheme cytochrome c subunit